MSRRLLPALLALLAFLAPLGALAQAVPVLGLDGRLMAFAAQDEAAPALAGGAPNIADLAFFSDPRPAPSFGFGHQRWWARIQTGGGDDPRAYPFLRVDAPSSDRILAFSRIGGGAWRPLPQLRARYAVFDAGGRPPGCTLLVMEETRSVVRFHISLLSAQGLSAPLEQALTGVVFGTAAAVSIFVGALWWVNRRPEFLHFIAYQVAASIVILRIWGYMPSLLLTQHPRLAAFLGVAGLNCWVLEFFNYARTSLNLRATHPRLDHGFTIAACLVPVTILGEALRMHYQWPMTVATMGVGLAAYLTVVVLKFRSEPARATQQLLGFSPAIAGLPIYLATLSGRAQLTDMRSLYLLGHVGSTMALALWMAQAFARERDRRERDLSISVRELEANRTALQLYQTDLEALVGVRTAELERALAIEREIVAQQRDFTSMVGHEFRTPLAVIDGQARRIERAEAPGVNADLPWRGREIREAVRGLIGLMDSLLSHARGDGGAARFNFDTARLADVVSRAVSFSVPEDRRPDVQIDVPAALTCRCDATLLTTAIGNILANAAKYSQAGSPVRVTAAAAPMGLRLTVRDRGLGISPAELETIFARFQRGSNALTIGGSGLGLFVTRQIIEGHGGSIAVRSTLGEGSMFIVILPAVENTAPGPGMLVAQPA